MRMRKLVLGFSLAKVVPEKINKIPSSNNLGCEPNCILSLLYLLDSFQINIQLCKYRRSQHCRSTMLRTKQQWTNIRPKIFNRAMLQCVEVLTTLPTTVIYRSPIRYIQNLPLTNSQCFE